MNIRTKITDFSQKHLGMILSVYILLQPLIDVVTSLGARAEHAITAGILLRTLFLALSFIYVLFVSDFRGKRGCLVFMGALIAYLAVFMLYMLRTGGITLCIANMADVVKTFFAPFVLVFFYAVYCQYGFCLSLRTLAWTGGIYAGIILLAFLTKTSFTSYVNSGHGYAGWFYAANEVSSIIALLAPVAICYCVEQIPEISRKKWHKAVIIAVALFALAFSAIAIGTKVIFGVVLLYVLVAAIWCGVRWWRERTGSNLVVALVLTAMFLIIVAMYFRSPLLSYIDNVYTEMWDKDSEIVAVSRGRDIDLASKGTWLRALMAENEIVAFIDTALSRRLLYASPSVQIYTDSGIIGKLLGIGYANTAAYPRNIEFMIEIDPLAILIRHGVLGFLVYYMPYVAVIAYFIVHFFKRPGLRLSNLVYCSYLYAALFGFAISMVVGHGLVSPAVSTFLVIITFNLGVLTRRQNKGEALE